MLSLAKNETWVMEELPDKANVVSCRWVFKSKLRPDGSIERRKARLVARGFCQTKGVDYFETFAPVVRYETVRTVIALIAAKDLEVAQFDVKTAFLNGSLDEIIHMEQPKGFEDGSDRVCRLKKGLYGLKQSPRNWNTRFNEFVRRLGFKQSDSDPCLYVKNNEEGDFMVLCLYVDDGLIACQRRESLDIFVDSLKRTFEITSHEPTCYVGMEIERERSTKTIRVNQQGYIKRVLSRFGMEDAKDVVTPMDPAVKLNGIEDDSSEDRFPYREAIGCLNYIATISRLDIAFAVNTLARHSNKPRNVHWQAAKRVMRYLKGTLNFALEYNASSGLIIIGYCDSDYAGEIEERKSTSGYVFKFCGGPVAWSSTLQRVTALSSSEAEYMAIAEAVKEVLWLRPLLESVGLIQSSPTELNVDNQAAIALSKNPEFHKRTKHIGVRFH